MCIGRCGSGSLPRLCLVEAGSAYHYTARLYGMDSVLLWSGWILMVFLVVLEFWLFFLGFPCYEVVIWVVTVGEFSDFREGGCCPAAILWPLESNRADSRKFLVENPIQKSGS